MSWLDLPLTRERPALHFLVHFALVMAAFLAINAIASVETDPVASAESRFLALLVGGVLACLAVLVPLRAYDLSWTALLILAAMWAVGHGPHRGALVILLLFLGLTLAAVRSLRVDGILSSPGQSVALAMGFQLLVRSDLLLLPLLDARTLVSLLALPLVAGWAFFLLARYFDPQSVALAAGVAILLSPGWNVTVTLAVACLAAGRLMADQQRPTWLRGLAATTLVIPVLWSPALGALFVIGALTFLVHGRASWLLSIAGIGVLFFAPPVRLGGDLLAFFSPVVILAPSLPFAPRQGRHLVLRGGFLALVASLLGGGTEVLAGGLVLAVLGLEKSSGIQRLQQSWVALLGFGTVLLASYPWIRVDPLQSFLELLGIGPYRVALVAALLVVNGGGLVLGFWHRRWPAPRPEVVLALMAFLALAAKVPPQVLKPISFEPVVLTADRPVWTEHFPPHQIAGGVMDSHLAHGAGLELGTWVATVRLRGPNRELVGSWDILAGFDTAEWAAGRPDVARLPGFQAPEPWLSLITQQRSFFSQRFRARFQAAETMTAATVIVRRNANLPEEVELTLYGLELRR